MNIICILHVYCICMNPFQVFTSLLDCIFDDAFARYLSKPFAFSNFAPTLFLKPLYWWIPFSRHHYPATAPLQGNGGMLDPTGDRPKAMVDKQRGEGRRQRGRREGGQESRSSKKWGADRY